MDFLTIRTKVAAGDYSSWEELEDDLVLMFDNAMLYNSPETIFHKLALSMKDLSRKMIELGKQVLFLPNAMLTLACPSKLAMICYVP